MSTDYCNASKWVGAPKCGVWVRLWCVLRVMRCVVSPLQLVTIVTLLFIFLFSLEICTIATERVGGEPAP